MKIVTISGLDGSGKSTQIELLKAYLENQGKRVFYFHAIQFSLANKLSGQKKAGTPKSVTNANIFQIALRKIFLQIDLWRFNLLRNKLRNKSYDYVLSDRYFYDSAVNIAYLSICHLERSGAKSKDLIQENIIRSLDYARDDISKPDMAFYLQTSPEIIMSRDRQPDQGLEYLKKKKELYDEAARVWEMKIIDGNREKNIIFEELKKICQI